jgi:hypothetical protein
VIFNPLIAITAGLLDAIPPYLLLDFHTVSEDLGAAVQSTMTVFCRLWLENK